MTEKTFCVLGIGLLPPLSLFVLLNIIKLLFSSSVCNQVSCHFLNDLVWFVGHSILFIPVHFLFAVPAAAYTKHLSRKARMFFVLLAPLCLSLITFTDVGATITLFEAGIWYAGVIIGIPIFILGKRLGWIIPDTHQENGMI